MFGRPVLAGVAAVAVLAFVGYLTLRSLNSAGPASTSALANTQTAAPAPAAQVQPQPATPMATQENSPSLATTTKQPQANINSTAPNRAIGGSIDEALHASNTLPTPNRMPGKGFDPSQPRPAPNAGLVGGQIPLTMVLQALGVHATWNGDWLVDSVQPNGVGSHAGVRSGDIIEALNGQPVGENTTFKGTFSGRSIRVKRNGAVLDLTFKP